MEDILKRIEDYALEEIMGLRFGAYAKEIIQDRAIPDVRDGLKPVQRRIIYAMYKAGNTHDHGYIKCAATVGDVLGKFHPHGDTSVYDAMVRMSQWWKQNNILVDIHGNNGSIDGDSAAAYRYTEARLSKISSELVKDLEKNTVAWAPNFDDRFLEPTVLPAKFPNLLVNGTNGISAGYATNIPPHNLVEVINATIKRIDSPNCRLDTILEIVKGPDFPTGGIACGRQGIIDAFTTGRGKVIVKSKTEFKREKGHDQIIVTEIPYDVNKANLVSRIDSIRIDKKIDGIAEVRDETDREGIRIAIDLKAGANRELILNYLLKNTDLQITYNYNMVAIVNRRPMTLGLLPLLDAYIAHEREVLIKRSEYDLAAYKKRLHIVEGFLKMISILDKVIKVIRASHNKSDAKDNLVREFDFSIEQAEAIVTLQLYKLTNTDVVALEEEKASLLKFISALELILSNEDKLKEVMKHELRKIRDEYGTERKTEIKDEIEEIKIDSESLIAKEDVMVVITHEGYIKRVSLRSFNKDEETLVKEGDYPIGIYKMNTMDNLLLFTDTGNYLSIPVYEIPDLKWKELGKHVSNITKISSDEAIIYSYPLYKTKDKLYVTMFTKLGMVKRTPLSDYSNKKVIKATPAIKLKNTDIVVSVNIDNNSDIIVITNDGYVNRYKTSEVPESGVKSGGVKAITIKNNYITSGITFNDTLDYLTVVTNKTTAKRIKLSDIGIMSRARRGVSIIREVKTNPYYIIKSFVISNKELLGIKKNNDIDYIKLSDIKISDLASTGMSISKANIDDIFVKTNIIDSDSVNIENTDIKENIDLNEVDKRILSIDDFLEDFKFDDR